MDETGRGNRFEGEVSRDGIVGEDLDGHLGRLVVILRDLHDMVAHGDTGEGVGGGQGLVVPVEEDLSSFWNRGHGDGAG
jgi:hypothetical protein